MALRSLILVLLGASAVLRLAGAGANPEKANLNGLVTNSPFGSAKSGAVSGANGNEPFEFRAVLEEGNNKFFSIYDTNTHRSTWVELNDPVNGFSVKSYDTVKETITMDYQGKVMTFAIKRAPAAAQVFQPPAPQQPPQVNGMPTIPQPTVGQPPVVQAAPTAIDQQRIQQIQEEIRRRRALRSQSLPTIPPAYGNGPQSVPSPSGGPVPSPTNPGVPQPVPQRN